MQFYKINNFNTTSIFAVTETHSAAETSSEASKATTSEAAQYTEATTTSAAESHNTESASAHTSESASHEEEGGIGTLGIDPIAIGAQAFTLLLLIFVLKKFVISKLVASLETRHKKITDSLKNSLEIEKIKADLVKSTEKELQESAKKAQQIIDDAKKEATDNANIILKKAEENVESMLSRAEGEINQRVEEARKQIGKDVATMVTELTKRVLEDSYDDKIQAKMIDKHLKEYEKVSL